MNWKLPTLPGLLNTLVSRGTQNARVAADDGNPGRFPVVVNAQTRAFLDAQAIALGTSVAALAGTILNAVAENTMAGEDAANSTFERIAQRCIFLLQQHGLSMPACADHMARFGIGIEHLRKLELMELQLTEQRIYAIASHFGVDRDWLAGLQSSHVSGRGPNWYKSPSGGAIEIARISRDQVAFSTRLLIVRDERYEFDNGADDHGRDAERQQFELLVEREFHTQSEILNTYSRLSEGRWSYWNCRRDLALLVEFLYRLGIHSDGVAVKPDVLKALREDKTFAVKLIGPGHRGRYFYPDDECRAVLASGSDSEYIARERELFGTLKVDYDKLMLTPTPNPPLR